MSTGKKTRPGDTPLSSLAEKISSAAVLACVKEASVEKPGNVSPKKGFSDAEYADFVASSFAISQGIADAARAGEKNVHKGLGRWIKKCVQDTQRVARSNTNLGIILLFVPLAWAAGNLLFRGAKLEKVGEKAAELVCSATPKDTVEIYRAIRLAGANIRPKSKTVYDVFSPGVDEKIIENNVTPKQVFSLSAGYDSVARELCEGYPLLEKYLKVFSANKDPLKTFLTILSENPDSLILRKKGKKEAKKVSEMAKRVLSGSLSLPDLSEKLGDGENRLNPGTSADLLAEVLFVSELSVLCKA